MAFFDRRQFFKTGTAALIPAVIPISTIFTSDNSEKQYLKSKAIKLYGDGEMFEPEEYIDELDQYFESTKFEKDRYGAGGAVEALENKFQELTGKEKAIFMPSGTMANQFAISQLSGEKSKIFVQETSHVYRDEADAAQLVFNKRLMPLAPGETYFSAQQLQDKIDSLKHEEAFKTGVGAVSIENPVRRADGKSVPIDEIRKISNFCRSNNIRLHLDGARIFIASSWTGISVKEYASYFDTVYISLYKYFGASSGAVLCGDKETIEKMPHLIKIHGGLMYGNWSNAAMALHRMEGFEVRLKKAIEMSSTIFSGLNQLPGVQIRPLSGGTNIFDLVLAKEIDGKRLQENLNKQYNIRIPRPNSQNHSMLTVNETLLYQNTDYVVNSFKESLK